MGRGARRGSALAVTVLLVASIAVIISVSAAGRPTSGTTPSPTEAPTPSPTPSPVRSAPPGTPVATTFAGSSAVGALFTVTQGSGLRHFCTGTVVRSPHEDLVITAAHCMGTKRLGPKGDVTFAPGYYDGKFPDGRWVVMSEIVDRDWQKYQDPNDDVAFLVVGRPGHEIEKYTGAETCAPCNSQMARSASSCIQTRKFSMLGTNACRGRVRAC